MTKSRFGVSARINAFIMYAIMYFCTMLFLYDVCITIRSYWCGEKRADWKKTDSKERTVLVNEQFELQV